MFGLFSSNSDSESCDCKKGNGFRNGMLLGVLGFLGYQYIMSPGGRSAIKGIQDSINKGSQGA
jgi:hypothetical protein